jgi:Holliday junction resolvase RusA-like endonuclease
LAGTERPSKKPDIDNIAKCFLDAMNGIIYLDDTQVVELHIKKLYSSLSGVDILVMEVE